MQRDFTNPAPEHPPRERRRRLGPPAAALCAAALSGLAGCSAQAVYDAESLHAQGRFAAAADALAPRMADDDGNGAPDGIEAHNTLWALLEFGKMQQDAGRFEASARTLDAALRLFDQLAEEEIISLQGAGNNLGAILTDERQRDYLGAYYDPIAATIAQVINMLMLGRYEEAATYARRAIDAEDASGRITERLELQRAAFDANTADDADNEQPDPLETAFEDRRLERRLGELRSLAADANGTNPYGFFAGGVAMLAANNPGEARDFAQRLEAAAGRDLLAGIASGRRLGDVVIVFFENGRAPARADGSLRLSGATVVPLPVLRTRRDGRAEGLTIEGGQSRETAAPLTNLDALVAADFNDRLIEIWGRPILSQSIKAAAAATGAAFTDNQDSMIDELITIAGLLWAATAEPDLRSWRTLPGEQAVAWIDRPADQTLTLTLIGPSGRETIARTVRLESREGPAFLFARSTAAGNLAVYTDRRSRPQAPRDSPQKALTRR